MKKILIAILMMAPMSLCAQKFAHFNTAYIIPNMKEYTTAMEEMVVNVISYAYPEGKTADIELLAESDGKELTFVLSDRGKDYYQACHHDADPCPR